MNHEYQQMKLTVTLDIDVMNLPEGVTLDKIAEMFNHDQWDEGRYPFYVEMAHEGLRQRVTSAIGDATQELMSAKYGHEMIVEDDGNTQTSKSYHETGLVMKAVYVGTRDSFKDCKLVIDGPDERRNVIPRATEFEKLTEPINPATYANRDSWLEAVEHRRTTIMQVMPFLTSSEQVEVRVFLTMCRALADQQLANLPLRPNTPDFSG
jgi:hypothetical protein